MRSPNVWKGQNSNECKNIRFCCKVFLHLIWFWHDPFWVRLKAMEGRVLQNRSRVCQNPFERVPLPRPNWTQLAWTSPSKHCTCILRNHKMVCPSHARTYGTPSPGTCCAWTWPGTLWARCPVRRFSNWRTSTSLISPSTRSRSLRRTLLLVSSFRIEKLTQHNDISQYKIYQNNIKCLVLHLLFSSRKKEKAD